MRDYEFYYTQDGSVGLYSYADNDVYHSKFGALSEAWEKFILPANIDDKLNKQEEIRVLDVCYGIGYNTKALMTHVINDDKKILKQNNFFKKNLRKIKFLLKNFLKKLCSTLNIVPIDTNNLIQNKLENLSSSIDTINDDNNFSRIHIDCLEINNELVKISPFLKTITTPQEIFSKIIPAFFDCFDTYWKVKKLLSKFLPKNKQEISELLELKFSNNYDGINKEYKLHKYVNYIIINSLLDYYRADFLTKEFKEITREKYKKHFFDKSLLKYAQFKQNYRYDFITGLNLFAILHNIYYDHLSIRDKYINFKLASKLFKLNFHVEDARKTILKLDGNYDYVFLDAFTYSKAPELWSVEFINEITNHLADDGIIMTYSNSALVRNTFLENNLYVGKIFDNNTGKFIGTIASKNPTQIKNPLTSYDVGLCKTKAGIPYHDPNLNLDKKEILKRREYEFKNSELLSSSQYMKNQKIRSSENENQI